MQPRAESPHVERKARIVRALVASAARVDGIIAAELRERGIPESLADTMWAIGSGGEPLTMRQVAERLRRDPSTVSLAADKLENLGLIRRRPHPDDGRKRTLELTDEGIATWAAVQDALHAADLFTHLDAAEQTQLLELLQRLGPRV